MAWTEELRNNTDNAQSVTYTHAVVLENHSQPLTGPTLERIPQ